MGNEEKKFGVRVQGWCAPPAVPEGALAGRYVCLEPLAAGAHATALFEQFTGDDSVWDYLPYGPFQTVSDFHVWVKSVSDLPDPCFFAVHNLDTAQFEGVASYLRISPQSGSTEVGHINFSPALQRTRAATEALYCMMRWAFEAGYRRFEWKCDALNIPSRRAAQRLGLSFEGIFRQATIVKGRNRDTAWFAAIDKEWPLLKKAFETWLLPENFDEAGLQRVSLSKYTAPILAARDPVLS